LSAACFSSNWVSWERTKRLSLFKTYPAHGTSTGSQPGQVTIPILASWSVGCQERVVLARKTSLDDFRWFVGLHVEHVAQPGFAAESFPSTFVATLSSAHALLGILLKSLNSRSSGRAVKLVA
jgi:hypothetical protein